MRLSPSWRDDPRGLLLAPLAVVHVWTMTWLAWSMVPSALRNPQLTTLGLAPGLTRGTLAALAVVVGGAMLAAVPGRLRRGDARRGGDRGITGGLVLGGAALGGAGLVALVPLGAASVVLAAAAGAAVAAHRVAGRFFPAAATVGAGLWHAVVMAIPDPRLSFAWPAVLALTHVVAISALTRTYGLDRPALSPRAATAAAMGWTFAALLLAGGMTAQGAALLPVSGPGGRWTWLWPAAAAGTFVVVALAVLARGTGEVEARERVPATPWAEGRHAAHRVAEMGMWWLMLYQASWLLGAGLWWPAGAVLGLGLGLLAVRVWWARSPTEPTYRLP